MYVCNHKLLFIDYVDCKISLAEVTINNISLKRETVQKTLILQNELISSVFNLSNVLYISQCSMNLISLKLSNQHHIYFDNIVENLVTKENQIVEYTL